MMQERPSYDSTQFIADVGGSLGFLLGLSVLGLIGILEHVRTNIILLGNVFIFNIVFLFDINYFS